MFKRYCIYLSVLFSIALTTLMGLHFTRILKAGFYAHQATLRTGIDPIGAFNAARMAFELCPRQDSYAILLGRMAEDMFLKSKNVAFVNLAARSFIWAIQAEPQEALNHFLAGIALLQVAQTGFANAQFDIATQLEPNNPIYKKRGAQ